MTRVPTPCCQAAAISKDVAWQKREETSEKSAAHIPLSRVQNRRSPQHPSLTPSALRWLQWFVNLPSATLDTLSKPDVGRFDWLSKPVALAALILALAQTIASANTGSCTLKWRWPYPSQTYTETRMRNDYDVVIVRLDGKVVEVRYGNAMIADRAYETTFHADPRAYIVGRTFNADWRADLRHALSSINCNMPPSAAHWHPVEEFSGYSYVGYRGPRCNFRRLIAKNGAVLYTVLIRNGFDINHGEGFDEPFDWKPSNPLFDFDFDCYNRNRPTPGPTPVPVIGPLPRQMTSPLPSHVEPRRIP